MVQVFNKATKLTNQVKAKITMLHLQLALSHLGNFLSAFYVRCTVCTTASERLN